MYCVVIYLKSHRRRPVVMGQMPGFLDRHSAIPVSWCQACGREVFLPGNTLCCACRKRKGERR